MAKVQQRIKESATKSLVFFKNTSYVHYVIFGLILVLLNVLKGFGLVQTSFISNIGNFLIMGIVAVGFLILLGYGGLASLGTAIFVFLGAAFARYFANLGVPFVTSLVLVILIGVILGTLIGFLSLRISGMYLAIITLAIAEAIKELFFLPFFNSFAGGSAAIRMPRGLMLFNIIKLDKTNMFYIIVVVFVLILMVTRNIMKSPAGRSMLSMKNSESAAQTMGVNLLKYRIFAFIISTVFALIGGFLLIYFQTNALLNDFDLNMSLEILAAVVIGGVASIWGILGGTFVIFTLKNMLNQNVAFFTKNPNLLLLFNGILMIAVVLFYPGGLSQLFITLNIKIKAWYKVMVEKRAEKKLEAENNENA